MAQSPGTKQPIERAELKIEAVSSSAGATVAITPKVPEDRDASSRLDAYGKLLADRLPRGEVDVLLAAVPASTDAMKRLKEHPAAFVVSNDGSMIRVQLIASDGPSRAAIHDFVRPVLTSAASPTSNHPGNNLGWDAPPATEPRK